ncbi:unnamed protein product [Penicillium bialowiezense]
MEMGTTKSESNSTPIAEQWKSLKTMFPQPDTNMSANDDLEAQILKAQAQLTQLKKQRELIDIQQKVAEESKELELARDRLLATTNGVTQSDPAASIPPTDLSARIEGPQKKQCVARDPPTGPSGISPPRRPSEPQIPRPAPAQAQLAQQKQQNQQQKQPKNQPKNQGKPAQPKPAQAKQQPKAQPKAQPANPPAPKPSPKGPKGSNANAIPITKANPIANINPTPIPSSSPKPNDQPPSMSLDQLRALAAASRTPSKPPSAPAGSNQTPVRPFNPPTQPASEAKSAGITQPPVPNVAVFNGRSPGEFRNYTVGMYPDWYRSEENKVNRALKHVSLSLEERYRHYIRGEPASKNTYATFCAFMMDQVQDGPRPDSSRSRPSEDSARARYNDGYQRPSQSVTDFSSWLMQWPPHFHNNDSERDRMRHLFEHLMNRVRNEADKTHLDFDKYDDFVDYLQWVEDSLDSRVDSLGRNRDLRPNYRKRSRD